MLGRENFALSFIVVFLSNPPSLSHAWSGEVLGITGGDTIPVLNSKTLEDVKIRLDGIDCPEGGQAFSKRAGQFTSKLVYGKVVEVKVIATDRYGRTVAMIYADKTLLNEELVKAGLRGSIGSIATIPFVKVGRTFIWEPSLIKGVCGLILAAYHLGSLGGRKESEVR